MYRSPMTTSGWLNSEALEGTSFPTNGTASSLRDLGIFGSACDTMACQRHQNRSKQKKKHTTHKHAEHGFVCDNRERDS